MKRKTVPSRTLTETNKTLDAQTAAVHIQPLSGDASDTNKNSKLKKFKLRGKSPTQRQYRNAESRVQTIHTYQEMIRNQVRKPVNKESRITRHLVNIRPLRPSARTRMKSTQMENGMIRMNISAKNLWINSSTPHSEWSKTRTRKKIWSRKLSSCLEDSWQSWSTEVETIQPRPATEQRIYQRHKSSHSIESTGWCPG